MMISARRVPALVGMAFLAAALVGGCAAPAERPASVALKIVAFNDFHGHLDVPAEGLLVGDAEVEAGGLAHFATAVRGYRAQSANVALVSAGDLVGASPLLAATFDDEPVVEAMNALGLTASAMGNHELDRGVAHLKRLQQGGCPEAGCRSGAAFAGARFPWLAANTFERATGKTLLPPYVVREYGGVRVAFIGITLKDMPSVLSPAAVAGLEFRDEADTVNALVPALEREGIEAIVVLVHQGGFTAGSYDECRDLRGPIVDIVKRLSPAVDVVVSGHTHRAYNCRIGGRLVTSAGAFGMLYTEIDLALDPVSHDVVASHAANHPVDVSTPEDFAVASLVAAYRERAPELRRPVGQIRASLSRRWNADGESAMGQLIADAQLAASRAAGADIALMNPGGIRAPLRFTADGTVTYEDVFAVYPFANTLVTMTLTGEQIAQLLEAQWTDTATRVLQVSHGFAYDWDATLPPGARVVPGSVMLYGEPLQPDRSYRVTVNSFLAAGGDGFAVLREGEDRTVGASAREALIHFMAQHAPLSPTRERRVRRIK